MPMTTLPKQIINNKYNPVTVIIPVGETVSEKIKLGAKSIMGLYIRNFTGTLYFNGCFIEQGFNLTGDPDAPLDRYSFAKIKKPGDVTGTRYSEVVGGDYEYIPLDFTVFGGPNWITIELSVAAVDNVIMELQMYDI